MRIHLRFRVSLVFLLFCLIIGLDLTAAQDIRTLISVDASNKNMDQILQEIEKKTNLKIVSDTQVASSSKFHDETFENEAVVSILTRLGCTAEEKGANLIVSRKKTNYVSIQPNLTITGTVTD